MKPQFNRSESSFRCRYFPAEWLQILSIVGVGLFLTIPIIYDGCVKSVDFPFHLAWSTHFTAQLFQGDFYPRWIQNMNAGFGSPSFFFYAPVPYYLTSILSLLSHYNNSACNALGLSSAIALIASGLSSYLWLRESVTKSAAAISSIIYMALHYSLYSEFSFAQYWAFVWIPLILYFSLKLARGDRFSVIGLSISLALLIATHLPSFLIFFLVPIGYTFVITGRKWKTTAVHLGLAIAIAFGLSAIYWLPAMTTQEFADMQHMLTGRFNYSDNFLFTTARFDPYDFRRGRRYLELVSGLMAGFAFCTWKASSRNLEDNKKRAIHYWFIVAMTSLFMMLPISRLIWDIITPLQKIQFPVRFGTVRTVASTALIASAISHVSTKKISLNTLEESQFPKNIFVVIYGLIAILLMTLIAVLPLQDKVVFPGSYNTPLLLTLIALILLVTASVSKTIYINAFFIVNRHLLIGFLLIVTLFLSTAFYDRYGFFERMNNTEISKILQASVSPVEHRPKWVPEEIFNQSSLVQLDKQLHPVNLDSGSASWIVKQWQGKGIVLAVNAAVNTKLTLHQFYYPGWTAKANSIHQNLPISFSKLGLLKVSVPKGQYEVTIGREPMTEEKIGRTISIASIVLLALLLLFDVLVLTRDRASL